MEKILTKDQLKALQVGAKLFRALAGTLKQPVIVTRIYGAVITVSTLPEEDKKVNHKIREAAKTLSIPIPEDATIERPAWTFSVNTGCEIDTDLGWDGIITGSFLTNGQESSNESAGAI